MREYKKEKKAAFASIGAVGAIAIVILVATFGTAFASQGAALMGDVADPAGSISKNENSSGGCSLNDDAFTDTSTVATADYVISKLGSNYSEINNRKTEIQKIIDVSVANGVNPAILIAFWGAEQSFKNPDQAFGCGNTGDGSQGASGIAAEAECAVKLIKRTISSGQGAIASYDPGGKASTDWGTPNGANRWTRLLYHYVMGREDQPEGNLSYNKYGYVSSSDSPRIKFLKLLQEDKITCTAAVTGQNVDINGTCGATVSIRMADSGTSCGKQWVKYPTSSNFYTTYGEGDGNLWLRSESASKLMSIVKRFYDDTKVKASLGDASRKFGGYLPPHSTHQIGISIDVDLPSNYMMANCEDGCATKSTYDTTMVKKLIMYGLDCGARIAYYSDSKVVDEVNSWAKTKGLAGRAKVIESHRSHVHFTLENESEPGAGRGQKYNPNTCSVN